MLRRTKIKTQLPIGKLCPARFSQNVPLTKGRTQSETGKTNTRCYEGKKPPQPPNALPGGNNPALLSGYLNGEAKPFLNGPHGFGRYLVGKRGDAGRVFPLAIEPNLITIV